MEKMVSSSNMQHHLHQQLQNQHDSNEVGGWLPPGFRFHPTDEELIKYYLENKVRDNNFQVQAISEVDLNKCEPWDLPEKAKMGEKEWYFYTLRDRKYPTGMRTNRATEAGYWKATGKDKDIFINGTHCLVGMKKTLVFYRGRAPKGEKTNWIMHEYRLEGESNQLQAFKTYKDSEWVVCRIFQKSAGGKKALFIKGTFYDESDGLSSLPPLLEQSDDATIDVDANLNSENGLSFPVLHERPYSRIKDQLDIWVRNKDAGASCSSSELIKQENSQFGYGYSGNQTHRISGPQTGFSPNFLPKFSEDPSLGRSEEFRQQPSSQFWKNVMEQCTRGSSDVKGCKIEPYGASEGTQYPISGTQHGYGGLMMESLAFEDSNVGNLLENEISTDVPSSGMYRNGNSNPSDLESMWAY